MNLEQMREVAYELRPKRAARSRGFALAEGLKLAAELAPHEQRHWKPRLTRLHQAGELVNTPGQYWQDARPPWLIADSATITLTTSQQNLWTPGELTQTFANDWWPGKQMLLRVLGRITTPAGGGAVTFEYGYGATPGTTTLASSAALAVTASQSNITWRFEGRVRCRQVSIGAASAGKLLGTGVIEGSVFTSTADKTIPASAPAEVTGLNLNQTSGIRLAATEAATTGATIVIHDLEFVNNN